MSSTTRLISELLDGRLEANGAYLDLIRVSKVQEEAGEAMAAIIAYLEVNPRKPAGPLDDVITELADVALTAMCAIEHFGYGSKAELAARERYVYRRLIGPPK